ncbi:TetR/AcrR family transcriptional regulator [Williamsia sp. M5A3_1d]
MTTTPDTPGNRLDRRKARTRAALIDAACRILESPRGTDASISEITELADVGLGSFYNHFTGKAELFDAAIATTLDTYGRLFDNATEGLTDPAEVFAAGVRMTLRLNRSHAQVARTMAGVGMSYLDRDDGLAPRALRDLEAARACGRFDIDDLPAALACTAGSLLGCLHLVTRDPDLDTDRVADELAANLLRMFGLSKADAHEVAHRPLRTPAPERA